MSDIEKLSSYDPSLGSKTGHRNGISENMLLMGNERLVHLVLSDQIELIFI